MFIFLGGSRYFEMQAWGPRSRARLLRIKIKVILT